jgi:uncharacterized protein YkwD
MQDPMSTILHLRRAALAAGSVAALALSAGPAHAQGCANADLNPTAGNVGKVQDATLCLINEERTSRGRPRLRASSILDEVAARYAHKMVAQSFFSHVSPGGSTFDQRIRGAGYLRGARGWTLGENLAWGTGALSTPRAIVRAWMHSPDHRRNLLDAAFRDTGLGVSAGAPVGGLGDGATYANEFGKRTG